MSGAILHPGKIEVFDGKDWFPLLAFISEWRDSKHVSACVNEKTGELEVRLSGPAETTEYYENGQWRIV